MAETFHPATIALMQQPLRTIWPRATVTGYVVYWASEDDGDTHFRIADTDDAHATDYVVCEIIPEIPMPRPALHQYVTVNGIVRWDIEHGWPELHPVLSWTPATPPTA
jgi:hypothetical protein